MERQTFHKKERLSGFKAINNLFLKGKSVTLFPLKIIYTEACDIQDFPLRITFTIPKKYIRKAYQRNRIRRILKEIYRKNKSEYYKNLPENKKYNVALVYIDNKLWQHEILKIKMNEIFKIFIFNIKNNIN
jgi:ribonuclease P protein component